MTGQYAYYEEQLMQSAYALAGPGGSEACVAAGSGGGAKRQGAAGYWYQDQERGTDWQARENMIGAFIAVDGSPEKAYFLDKLSANTAVWEGLHNITYNTPGSYNAAWTFGNTIRRPYPSGGTTLGSWTTSTTGGSGAYPPHYPLCYGNTTSPCPSPQFSNSPFGANANFQNAYSSVMLGWMNDFGYCPQVNGQCEFLTYTANHFINEALNPASNIYHLSDYVYPTLDSSGNQITSWTEDQALYVPGGQTSAWPACGAQAADEWYTAEAMAAMSYFYNMTSSQGGYSGASAYNAVRSGAIVPCIADFSNNSPKWDIVPRATDPLPAP
jgi:hypothetical protein